MSLSKEQVELFSLTFAEMQKRAEYLWEELRSISPQWYSYFQDLEKISIESPSDGFVYLVGYDGDSACDTSIPMRFFYEEDWREQAEKIQRDFELAQAEKERVRKETMEAAQERRDREQYEKLKAKYESGE